MKRKFCNGFLHDPYKCRKEITQDCNVSDQEKLPSSEYKAYQCTQTKRNGNIQNKNQKSQSDCSTDDDQEPIILSTLDSAKMSKVVHILDTIDNSAKSNSLPCANFDSNDVSHNLNIFSLDNDSFTSFDYISRNSKGPENIRTKNDNSKEFQKKKIYTDDNQVLNKSVLCSIETPSADSDNTSRNKFRNTLKSTSENLSQVKMKNSFYKEFNSESIKLENFTDMQIEKDIASKFDKQLISKPNIPGVRFDNVGHRWVASWSSGGKQIQKYFPSKKYGNTKARELAINARQQAMLKDGSNLTNDQKSSSIKNINKNLTEAIEQSTSLKTTHSGEVFQPISNTDHIQPEQLANSHVLDKTLFVLVPEHSLLVSLPATIQRVPVLESNNGDIKSHDHIEIISLPNLVNQASSSLTHIDAETIKIATDLARRVSDSLSSGNIKRT